MNTSYKLNCFSDLRALVFCAMIVISGRSFACSPPLPLQQQQFVINTITNSETFRQALASHQEIDPAVKILQISFQPEFTVDLSNHCSIQFHIEFLAPEDPGLCPRVNGVTFKTVCL